MDEITQTEIPEIIPIHENNNVNLATNADIGVLIQNNVNLVPSANIGILIQITENYSETNLNIYKIRNINTNIT